MTNGSFILFHLNELSDMEEQLTSQRPELSNKEIWPYLINGSLRYALSTMAAMPNK